MSYRLCERLESRQLFAGAPPVATAFPHDVEADGSSYYDIPLQFFDTTGLNRAGIARSHTLVRVSGPNGYRAYGNLWALDGLDGEREIFGHYSITPPGGSWTSDDAGTYKVSLLGDTLQDVEGNATPAMKIGAFHVTASETSPGPLPAPTEVIGRYRGTLKRGSTAEPPRDFDLTIKSVRGNRVEGVYYPSPSDPNAKGIAVHGVLKPGGKISLTGIALAESQPLSIVARLSGNGLRGNVSLGATDGSGESELFTSKRT